MKKLVQKKPSELTPYFKNPRKNEDAIPGVAESIKAFGFQAPILTDEKFLIIAGHTRWKAALKLNMTKVPVVTTDELSDSKKRAYRIADNKYGERAEWDFEFLKDELEDLDTGEFDLDITGFSMDDIEELFTKYGDEYEGLTDDDAIPEDVETRCKTGDLWQLGRHRLLCGDATKKEDIEKLMGSEKADLIFTDPPYNVGKDYGKETNDNKSNTGYVKWSENWFFNAKKTITENIVFTPGAVNLWFWYSILKPKWLAIWIKKNQQSRNGAQGWNAYEPVLVYGKVKVPYDVWDELMDASEKIDHPVPKTVKAWLSILESVSDNKNIIVDLFLGSGTTIISCEKSNRICYGLEISPHFCDVIIQRWEDYAGKKAQKIN